MNLVEVEIYNVLFVTCPRVTKWSKGHLSLLVMDLTLTHPPVTFGSSKSIESGDLVYFNF